MEPYRQSRLKQIRAKKVKRKPLAAFAWLISCFLFICSIDSYYGGWPIIVPVLFLVLAWVIIILGARHLENTKHE